MDWVESVLGAQPGWMMGAACSAPGVDPEIFVGPSADLDRARQMCRRCPVLAACDAWAIDHATAGTIWAGIPR